MDLFAPSDTRPVHFMGIGGAGMSALALLAARRGVKVTGCDTDPAGAADVAALGATVEAGHHVLVNLSAANLDPAEFSDPLDVQFDRAVNRHVAFGGGVHRCLGSHLARRELRVALREWHTRIPEYTLTPGYEVGYLPPLRFVPDLQLTWSTP